MSGDFGSSGSRGAPGRRLPAAAFLRVYEPLDELRGAVAVDVDGNPLSGADFASREHRAALRAASALPPRPVADLDLAPDPATRLPILLLAPPAEDGVVRGCPADLTLRALLALDDLRARMRPSVLHAFMPPQAVAEAADRTQRLLSRGARVPHVRSSAWHVPLPWLAVFRPDQLVDGAVDNPASASGLPGREPSAADGSGSSGGGQAAHRVVPSVRYLASMADARRAVARTLAAVRKGPAGRLAASDFLPLTDLEDLGRWLEEFHARSIVELDFGGLVELLRDATPSGDDSVETVSDAIAALPQSPEDALERFTSVRDKWAAVRVLEHAS